MENKEYIIPIILGLIIIGIFIFSIIGWSSNSGSVLSSSASFKHVETGTTEQGDVSIVLTPKIVGDKLEVEIAANTHSVDLTQFNLKEITSLEYAGEIIKPSSVPILSGHHASGNVVFDVNKDIKDFTIKIIGMPKINERIFKWS